MPEHHWDVRYFRPAGPARLHATQRRDQAAATAQEAGVAGDPGGRGGPEANPTTIAIVENHGIARAGAEHLIVRESELRVVASVATVSECAALSQSPDLVVLDLAACDPADSAKAVTRLAERSAVLVISRYADGRDLTAAFRAGALGLVTRDTEPADFVAAVQAAARGGLCVPPAVTAGLAADLRHANGSSKSGLSGREAEALQLLAKGFTHAQIARRMGVAEATVNTYIKRIRGKLKAGNKADLTRMAIDLGYAS
jgi:DNA-binding NarL/FixJ family response regulator